jgi:hypothetical protein
MPAKLQATKSLVLKAVAEAQKSVAANPPKNIDILEKKPPAALFSRSYREKTTISSRLAVTVTNSPQAPMEVDGSSSVVSEQKEWDEDKEIKEEMESTIPTSPESSVETRFIVTLDGFHLNVDDESNPDEEDSMMEGRNIETQPLKIKSRLYRRRSTGNAFCHDSLFVELLFFILRIGSDAGTQQSLERCKYWPSCRQGDRCSYHHPSLPCK